MKIWRSFRIGPTDPNLRILYKKTERNTGDSPGLRNPGKVFVACFWFLPRGILNGDIMREALWALLKVGEVYCGDKWEKKTIKQTHLCHSMPSFDQYHQA